MSIQRYDTKENWVDGSICDFGPDSHGRYVLHADHLTDKQSALDAQQTAHAAEVERLTAERDAAVRERDVAVEALRFYADRKSYDGHYMMSPHVTEDQGKRARAVLVEIEGRQNATR